LESEKKSFEQIATEKDLAMNFLQPTESRI
jgi:hypothetical protein